ncbi:IS4 family transposase [Leucobacter sp. wl10]|uniref:IS4 family transposase n=1 Tax=Leucobacter sp. wl10 TaxID=2304677 RepID=UPI000E5B115C|nr:IS4 family transposase [Leucobacter sp. wl10]RGE15677.1 IS4 family transposase [Leucobacter sp. wl10]
MPRSGWRKPVSDVRLSDAVSVGVLTRVFPPVLVDEVIAECGRTEQRRRSLSARAVAYFAIGMALHSDGSYEDVLAVVTDGLAWAAREDQPERLASKAAISHARSRLGAAPLEALFRRVVSPLSLPGTPGGFLAGRRLVAIDGTCLDVADAPGNDEHFGRPGVMKGERAAFPQARVVAVAECGSHAVIDAVVDPYTVSENAASGELLDRLESGMLCLADRGFYSHAAWTRAAATGADLCWRVQSRLKLPVLEALSDGSWISAVCDSKTDKKREHPTRVRVIEYTINDGRAEAGPYRLITTILDPEDVPAAELAAAYAQRWEIETAFDELKTHQRGPRKVLRSGTPELVRQEIWGHLCCHYAIRSLMFDAATVSGHDPDRVSFVTALRISRRSIAQQGAFPPSAH